jgi:hypothetical protein
MAFVRAGIVERAKTALARLSAEDVWRLAQATAASAAAWLIAKDVLDHPEPFFAPISALVSLNTSVGERGLNALRLLQGVVLGIAVGELTLWVLGGGYGSLALAVFASLVLAQALGRARIVVAQAAASAILTVAVANGEVGYQRLVDALVGAGVALVFSQVLFSPEPLRLLRRFEAKALAAMADALELTARALEGDEAVADRAIGSQRELRDHLSELARMRRATSRVARHTRWRSQITPLVQENEDAGQLDLLGGSCLLLTRTSLEASDEDRRLLAPYVRTLSETLADLALDPGDRATRQNAVERALEVLPGMRSLRTEPDGDLTATMTAARIAVTDLMLFVGVDPADARAATHVEATGEPELDVPAPAPAQQPWFRPLLRRLRRTLPFGRRSRS